MIAFNLQTYVDFDIPSTECIMIAPAGMSKKAAKLIANEADTMFRDSTDVKALVKYLRTWGCEPVKSYGITVGGNL